jgi:hypothetical protein
LRSYYKALIQWQAFNINFVNNNGTAKDIATLGLAVKSSKYASLYGKPSGALFIFDPR